MVNVSHRDSSRSITQDPSIFRSRNVVAMVCPAGDAIPGDERSRHLSGSRSPCRGRPRCADRRSRRCSCGSPRSPFRARAAAGAERRQYFPDRGDVAAAVRVGVAPQGLLNRGDVRRSRVAAAVSRYRSRRHRRRWERHLRRLVRRGWPSRWRCWGAGRSAGAEEGSRSATGAAGSGGGDGTAAATPARRFVPGSPTNGRTGR